MLILHERKIDIGPYNREKLCLYCDLPTLEVTGDEIYGKGNYIETKPLHPSQKPVSWIDNQTAEVTLYVKINNELEAILLSYGNDLEVIEPEELKNRLKVKRSN